MHHGEKYLFSGVHSARKYTASRGLRLNINTTSIEVANRTTEIHTDTIEMCNTKDLVFACHHITTIVVSTCRGTYTRTHRDHDEPLPACSGRDAELRLRLLEKCPWCARKEKYATLRAPVERIRTINYHQPTVATKRAVVEAEASYEREMATLGKMNIKPPGKRQKVPRVMGQRKAKGGSPLRRELKRAEIDEEGGQVEETVDEECESEDDGPSPSLIGDIEKTEDELQM